MDNNFNEAVALIKSGKKNEGRQLLAVIIKKEPHNIDAWLWMTSCVNSNEQRSYCLKKVLEIDPNHNVALSALSKLSQPEQPSEQDILGKNSIPEPQISNSQSQNFPSSISNANATRPTFQPRYLTAFAGMLTVIGTFLPWAALVYDGKDIIESYLGLTQLPGMFTAVIGVAIIIISLFIQTKPDKPNSLASTLLALITILMACLWPWAFHESCWDELFGNACEYQTMLGTGFGYTLSMFSLFLAFVFGLIRNPK